MRKVFKLFAITLLIIAFSPNVQLKESVNSPSCEGFPVSISISTEKVYATAVDTKTFFENNSQMQQYEKIVGNKSAKPNITKASGLMTVVFKILSFCLGCIGVVVILLLMIRLCVDVLIVCTGSEMGYLKGFSSFGGFAMNDKHLSVTDRGFNIPNSIGEYMKTHMVDIIISVMSGVIFLTGAIFPLSNKLVDLAVTGIDTIFSLDMDSKTTNQNGLQQDPGNGK